MKKVLFLIALVLAFVFSVSVAFAGDVYVRGYYRKDGTYVQPHYRSAPDGNASNNWSTRGNVNPYTGQPGTRDPSPSFSDRDSGIRGSYNTPYGSSPFNSNPSGLDPYSNNPYRSR